MSALGAVLGKRTWLGAGAILLAAAGGCALGALLVVKGVLPEGGALAWGCGCWALAAFAGGRVAVWGRGEGTTDGGSEPPVRRRTCWPGWRVRHRRPDLRTGGLYRQPPSSAAPVRRGCWGADPEKSAGTPDRRSESLVRRK